MLTSAQKQVGVTLFISDKADCRIRKIIWDKDGHYIIIEGQNTYQIDRTAQKIDKSTIIVGDFNTPPSVIDKSSRQKIGKEIVELNGNINQLDLIDISKTLHPTRAEYIWNVHKTLHSGA